MDFPRAWEISRATPVDDHDPRCSYRQHTGGFLCDCHVITAHPEHAAPDTPPTARPFEELTESGLLWLINASVLHPRGVALALVFDDAGHATGWRLLGDGGEPWSFPDGPEIHERFRAANATIAKGGSCRA